jgi:hypothetical protein
MKISLTLALGLCCAALAPAAVMADDQQYRQNQENQQACMADAMAFCGQFIPDRERVAACLISNRLRVSAPCRQALAHWHG